MFSAHLTSAACHYFGVTDPSADINIPENSDNWLEKVVDDIARSTLCELNPEYPSTAEDSDEVYAYHRAVCNMGFLYDALRNAIRYEDGPKIIRLWRYWLIYFLGCGKELRAGSREFAR